MKRILQVIEMLNPTVCWLVVMLFLLNMFSQGLAEGGRWDLYEAIAMADRWENGFGYSNGGVDFYKPSTPYFPGVSILALLLSPFGRFQIILLLFIASALVIVLFCMLYLVYKKNNGKWSLSVFLVFSIAVSYYLLTPWLGYAKEFKPDTASLVFFVLGIVFYTNVDSRWWRGVLMAITFSVALTFKQQVIAPEIGFLIALSLENNPIRAKIVDVAFILFGITVALLAVLFIDGGYFYAIQSHIGRSIGSINDAAHKNLLMDFCKFFFLIFFLFGSLNFIDGCLGFFRNNYFLIPAIAWFIVCILGAINTGGNIGNTAVGIVLFIPLIACFLEKSGPMAIFLLSFYLITSLGNSLLDSGWLHRFQNRASVDSSISKFVSDIKPSSVLISGDSYMAVRGLGIPIISEIDTWAHILIGINKTKVVNNGNALINELDPDIIICVQGCQGFDPYYSFNPEKNGYKEIPIPSLGMLGVVFLKK
jgi:hypothetical protein